jgi:hypothetical protein
MVDYKTQRNELEKKIKEVTHPEKPDEKPVCQHEWSRFKKTIRTENDKFTGRAYFIVKACPKCKEQHNISYIVEK